MRDAFKTVVRGWVGYVLFICILTGHALSAYADNDEYRGYNPQMMSGIIVCDNPREAFRLMDTSTDQGVLPQHLLGESECEREERTLYLTPITRTLAYDRYPEGLYGVYEVQVFGILIPEGGNEIYYPPLSRTAIISKSLMEGYDFTSPDYLERLRKISTSDAKPDAPMEGRFVACDSVVVLGDFFGYFLGGYGNILTMDALQEDHERDHWPCSISSRYEYEYVETVVTWKYGDIPLHVQKMKVLKYEKDGVMVPVEGDVFWYTFYLDETQGE